MERKKYKPQENDIRTAKTLKKEYDMFMKYANRSGAPKVEADYYKNIAYRVSGFINWKLLETKKKEPNEVYYGQE